MSARSFTEEEEALAEEAFLPERVCPPRTSPSPPSHARQSLPSIVRDILRTKTCVPGSLFLVESIDAQVAVGATLGQKRKHQQQGTGRRAVRLVLGDGELCIQALLAPSLHSLVDGGLINEGCLVRLERFRLRVLLRPAPGARCGPPTVFLIVEDMLVEEDKPGKAPESNEGSGLDGVTKDERGRAVQQLDALPTPGVKIPLFSSVNNEARDGMEQQTGTSDTRTIDSPPHTQNNHLVENYRTNNHASTEESAAPHRVIEVDKGGSSQPLKRARVDTETSGTAGPLPSWVSRDLTRPVKLTTLKTIPLLPYKQNWMVNVLAIVSELSDVEPSPLPPYTGKQRTARLADPSTGKRVLLTVFLDPEDFAPKVGSAVILLGVKNHRFDGGSLKKYASDRPKDGGSWWFEDPEDIDWCDVKHLKDWWASTQS
ncbi:hypothetical protein PpBr36_07215 [Pyricularia pennisetigena]|uniref:hypothetical protein n=1 Tax=Pyricularia pennisetigena TaxID=1578925 RepID=UPI001153D7A6|nr:hypothetical protein PpBr36_07215 [Pyricularia pennisetigena]TLS25954.1 hypothetical protein PpBr36_07215 [Pyricularia pennisetigena]